MSIRHAQIIVSAACLVVTSGIAQAQAALSLDEALRLARSNYDVAVARSAADAAGADVLAADRAPFPQLTAKLGQIDAQNGVGPSNPWQKRIDKSIGVDWTWERGNKRELRTEAARRGAVAAGADVEEQATQQAIAASGAFFDLLCAQQRVDVVEINAATAAESARVARRRFDAGDIARIDATRLDIDAERARGDVRTATLDRDRAALALSLAIGTRRETLVARDDWPDAGDVAAPADVAYEVEDRADVRAARERVAAAEAGLDSATAQKKADVTLGASVDSFPGVSTLFFELRLVVPLQIGYQYQGETGRALAQLTQARDLLDKARLSARLEIQRLRAEADISVRRWRSYEREILPRATEVAAQAELAYQKGGVALSDLLDARRTLRATQIEAIAAHTDFAKAATAWRLRAGVADKAPLARSSMD